MWKPDICVFHGNCDDGFGAAWAVWKRWGDDVQFIPGVYGKPIEADVSAKRVMFVDFSLKRPEMMEFVSRIQGGRNACEVLVIDHHKTAADEIAPWTIEPPEGPIDLSDQLERLEGHFYQNQCEGMLPIVSYFDMERSGAVMTWEFCHPGVEVPRILLHVQDRDLWRFDLPYTAEISAYLRAYKQTFDRWDAVASDISTAIMHGGSILLAHKKIVEQCCEHTSMEVIDGHSVPCVNVPYHYASDCADRLLKLNPDAPFAVAWFKGRDGLLLFSLRSRSSFDVSEVAKKFGGGGHAQAAGFKMTSTNLPLCVPMEDLH